MSLVSIIIPTYNERDNIELLLDAIHEALKGVDYEVVVVDDNSPDGTAEVVAERSAREPCLKLLKREKKLGISTAILQGASVATGDYILMMDADLSHDPKDIKKLLAAAPDTDIVVGSRHVPGGTIVGWTFRRRLTSRIAILLSRLLLRVPVRDTTSGFALFRKGILEKVAQRIEPRGFKLVLASIAVSPEAKVAEVPITFTDRRRGQSKFGAGEVLLFLQLCWRLRKIQKQLARKRDASSQA